MIEEFFTENSGTIISTIFILILTFIAAKVAERLVDSIIKKSKANLHQYKFIKHFLVAIVYIVGIAIAAYNIPYLKTLSVSLLAGAGVLAVIAGFASQHAFSNVVSGVFIMIFRPFSIGHKIKIGNDVDGVVEDITLRHTVIRTYENNRMIIPNSVISSEKIENANFGDEKICKYVQFGISYDSDIDKAMKIMQEEAMKHPFFMDNRSREEKEKKEPAVAVRVIGFGDSSVNLRAWVWSKDPGSAYKMGCDLNKTIKQRFDKEGIEIPFPYRTIVYKKEKKKKRVGL